MISLLTSWLRGFGGSSILLSIALVGGALTISSTPIIRWDQEGATAWLSVEVDGAVALVDSSVPGQAAIDLVEVAEAGADLEVHQVNGDALVLNRTQGTVQRVDAATRTAGERLKVLTGDTVNDQVSLALGANGDVWVIAPNAARKIDPERVTAIGATQTIPAAIAGAESLDAVVDGDGQLWVAGAGSIASSRDGFDSIQVFDGELDLGLVAHRPAALDVAGQQLQFLGDGSACDLDVSSGAAVHMTETVALVTDPGQAKAYFVTPRCKITEIDGLIDASSKIGDTIEVDDWMYLADTTSQQVLIVNVSAPNDEPILRTDRLSANGTDSIELLVVGGVVFYNQPESRAAGVIDRQSAGGLAPVEKSAPTGFVCAASAEAVLIDDLATLQAVRADSGQALDEALWFKNGQSGALGEGDQITIATDEPGVARYYFVMPDGRRQECPPVTVSEQLPVQIVDEQPGIKTVGDTVAFRSQTSDPGSTYLWSVVGGPATIVSGDDERSVLVELTGPGTVTVSLEITRDGSTASDEFSVTVRSEAATPSTLRPGTTVPDPNNTVTTPTTAPTTGTTGRPIPPEDVQIRTAANITYVGETSFHFNFHSNEVCAVSGVSVTNTETGELVGSLQHQPFNGRCETLHGSFPGAANLSHFPIEPGTTYTVTAYIVGAASDGVWPEGRGRDSMTFEVVTRGQKPGPVGPPQPVQIATSQNITYIGETSFHFNFHSNEVCAVSGVSVTETATGVLVDSYQHSPSAGRCETLHGSFPGHGILSFFDIKPGTEYTVTAYIVGAASDGYWPEGEGSDSMTFRIKTDGEPPVGPPTTGGPEQVRIATGANLTFVGDTSFHFNFRSNEVCAVSGVSVTETDTGVSVGSFQHPPFSGRCEDLHGSFPGAANLSHFVIKPGTAYTVTAYIVGAAGDGIWPEGSGRDSMTFQVVTVGTPPTTPTTPDTTAAPTSETTEPPSTETTSTETTSPESTSTETTAVETTSPGSATTEAESSSTTVSP